MALEIIHESPFSEEITSIFRAVISVHVNEHDVDSVLVAGYSLASKRAAILGRDPFPLDVEYALSLLCWWPLKPRWDEAAVQETRRMAAAAVHEAARGNPDPLDALVPDVSLTLSHEALYALQRLGPEAVLAPEVEEV